MDVTAASAMIANRFILLTLPTAKSDAKYISDEPRIRRSDSTSAIEMMRVSQIPKDG
jgi:hypothetical protein